MVEYKERLMQALALAQRSTKELQHHLGVTYQAMKSLEDGKTKALSVENNARAARYLELDTHSQLFRGHIKSSLSRVKIVFVQLRISLSHFLHGL